MLVVDDDGNLEGTFKVLGCGEEARQLERLEACLRLLKIPLQDIHLRTPKAPSQPFCNFIHFLQVSADA
ncbi:unnamed protein product [Arctogadus glacialis]